MSRQSLPLTASDLRVIADALEPIETSAVIAENASIGRIEVVRPDGDADDVCGYFVRENEAGSGDAWFGFQQVSS